MPFKLTKADMKLRDEILEKLSAQKGKLDAAIAKFNDMVAIAHADVKACVEGYNEVLSEAREFAADTATQASDDYDAKSERWQESAKGQAAAEFKSAWEDVGLAYVKVDAPERLSIDTDHEWVFEALPTEMDM